MLNFYYRLQDMDFAALMAIYLEGNQENAADRYPQEPAACGIMLAEQDFYQYLRECFFPTPGARYAVWIENGEYVSALRLEPYQDGLLLEALETKPEKRHNGYAKALIRAVLQQLKAQGGTPVYSHVSKRNIASIRTHESCDFRRILDYAVYADGSVLTGSVTYRYDAADER